MEPDTIPLRDLHLPDATGLWPLAPGWWVVIAIVVVLLAIWCRQMWLSWRDGASRRHALRRLDDLHATYRESGDVIAFANDMSELLRRTMLAYVPRKDIAGLTGQAWLDWLDHDLPIPQFAGAAGRGLLELPYRDPGADVSGFDVNEMMSAVKLRLRTPVGSSR